MIHSSFPHQPLLSTAMSSVRLPFRFRHSKSKYPDVGGAAKPEAALVLMENILIEFLESLSQQTIFLTRGVHPPKANDESIILYFRFPLFTEYFWVWEYLSNFSKNLCFIHWICNFPPIFVNTLHFPLLWKMYYSLYFLKFSPPLSQTLLAFCLLCVFLASP